MVWEGHLENCKTGWAVANGSVVGEQAAAADGSAAETMTRQNQSAVPARSQTLVEIRFAGAAGSLEDAARENPSAAD